MNRFTRILALVIAASCVQTPLLAQSRRDSLDIQYIIGKLTTLKTSNGVGDRRKLADSGIVRATALLPRLRVRVDTVIAPGPVTPPPPPANTAPVARFSRSCASATRLCAVNASASTDDKSVAAFSWAWGDGQSGAGAAATHSYPAPGSFTITLTVRDAEGLSSATAQTITLQPQPSDTAIAPDTIVVPPPTPPPVPPLDTTAFASLFGPGTIQTVSASKALGGVFAQYETNFVTFDEQQWATNGGDWAQMDYYDRALIYFAWWKRSGDAKYLARANAVALSYRKSYLEPNNYAIQAHWSMMDGVAAHYLATGDTMSKIAVGKVADLFIGLTYRDNIGGKTTTDNRVQARYLVALLLANSIKAPSLGIGSPVGIPGGHDWAAELRRALPLILGTQDADGAWRLSFCDDGNPTRVVHPFTTGLLLDALGRYYDTFEADARIPPAIKRGADYLWATQWDATGQAFKYIERLCPNEGSPALAPDLNNLILPAYAWLYARTGDVTYKTRAAAIFAGAVTGAWISPSKQFNQVYSSSWRFLRRLQ